MDTGVYLLADEVTVVQQHCESKQKKGWRACLENIFQNSAIINAIFINLRHADIDPVMLPTH